MVISGSAGWVVKGRSEIKCSLSNLLLDFVLLNPDNDLSSKMCSICKLFPPQKWEIFEAMTSARFFHPTPMNSVEKWHSAYHTSGLTPVYEQAVSPLEGAKLISSQPFLPQKCTSNLWYFHLPPPHHQPSQNSSKWANHVSSQGVSSTLLSCSHFH